MTWQIYNADCLDFLRTLPDGSVDAVVTDPPYGINACRMTLGKGKKEFARGDWDQSRPDLSLILAVAPKCCIWGGNYFADILPVTNHWLIWHKKNDGRSFSECEMAWTNFGKQTRHLSKHWSGEKKIHPTQKPIDVIKWCLSFLPEGCTVFDPFAGSGTTGVACIQTGRNFIGCEIDAGYAEIARRRCKEAEEAIKPK